MAWCLLFVLLLLLSTAAGDIVQVCEEKETTGSYFALFHSDSTSGFPCECVITSTQTLSFVFKWEAGGDHSNQSNVTLRSMNGDKHNEVLLVDREVVNGSHFVLTFPETLIKRETSIHVLQDNKTFTVKCSPKVDGGSYSTNTVTQKNRNKDDTTSGTFVHTSPYTVTMEASTTPVPGTINDVVVAVSCAAAVASVLFGIAVVWCVRRTRKQRLQVTDKRQDNLYDIADHLIEPRAASPPMMSLMTNSSCDSGTHSANTAFHTNTTLRTNTTDMLSPATAPRTVSESDYDTAGDTVRRSDCLQHTEHDTYITLKRDYPRGEAGTTGATVYDQCHPTTDTHRGSGDNGRPLDDTYSRLQRGQERQPVIGNIYDTTSVAVAVLSGL